MNREQQQGLIQGQIDDIVEGEGWSIIASDSEFELHLDVRAWNGQRYHLLLDLGGYDIEPPKLCVISEGGEVTWNRAELPPPPFLNGSIHPGLNRDFFCIPGTFDYHSHPLHEHESWDALRNNTPLAELVSRIVRMLTNPPVKMLGLGVGGLHKAPFKRAVLHMDSGQSLQFEVPDGFGATLHAIEIALANNQVIRLEVKYVE